MRGATLAEAARRLEADASTVFRSVQRIEKSLGQRLFERSRLGYLPTEPMLGLVQHAERIEAELEAARASAQRPAMKVWPAGCALLTTDAVLRGLVLPSLKLLLAQRSLLQLDLRTGNELRQPEPARRRPGAARDTQAARPPGGAQARHGAFCAGCGLKAQAVGLVIGEEAAGDRRARRF